MRVDLAARLRALVGDDAVIDHPDALGVYECDGYTLERGAPGARRAAAHARSRSRDVVRLLRGRRRSPSCRAAPAPVSPAARLPVERAGDDLHQPAAIASSRSTVRNRRVVAQAGVVNLWVSQRGARATACSTRPIRRARRPARSAATSPRTPAARTRSSTASPPTTCSGVELVLPDGEVVTLGGAGRGASGLRPGRPRRRLRGHLRHRHARDAAPDARSRGVSHAARRLRVGRRRERGGVGHHRRAASCPRRSR